MTELNLYNTLSRKIEPLYAADGHRLRHYCCGPTVYGPGHIGNFRTFLINDVLFRTARLAGLNPLYVRNLTDVDDKTIRDAQAAGQSLREFTDRWTQYFRKDCERLNMLPPEVEPRATEHITEQVELASRLAGSGHAYQGSDGSLYYQVSSFPGYGKLSGLSERDLKTQETTSAGARNLADEYDRDQVADFALWKSWKETDGDNAWDSPWGRGRPGWHLECSAMSMKYLGESFDLHTGGEDLCFPHHENEIAQSEAATGQPFVRHWMHTVFLLVDGKKMSKSLGNFYTVQDLVDKGFNPMAIRYALISGHYRKQLNFTLHTIEAAESALEKLAHVIGSVEESREVPEPRFSIFSEAWAQLCQDLNTAGALGALFAQLKHYERSNPEHRNGAAAILYALGLQLPKSGKKAAREVPEEVMELARERWEAKQSRDFTAADQIRERLKSLGWSVLDRKDGYDLQKSK